MLSGLLFGAQTLVQARLRDDTVPEIRFPDEPLEITVDAGSEAMLEGVTAWDEKDGDLTGRLIVQQLERSDEDGSLSVTYAVADGDRHVVTRTRTVIYTDYTPPRFALSKELCYTPGAAVKIRDRLTAEDVIDGSISDRIKITANGVLSYYEGSYPLTVEVTNSLGDTSRLELEIEIRSYTEGEPRIKLSSYLIYLGCDEKFDANSYIEGVTGAEGAKVTARLPAGGLKKGVNKVVYSCKGDSGTTGKTTLYVVVE